MHNSSGQFTIQEWFMAYPKYAYNINLLLMSNVINWRADVWFGNLHALMCSSNKYWSLEQWAMPWAKFCTAVVGIKDVDHHRKGNNAILSTGIFFANSLLYKSCDLLADIDKLVTTHNMRLARLKYASSLIPVVIQYMIVQIWAYETQLAICQSILTSNLDSASDGWQLSLHWKQFEMIIKPT